MNRIDLLKRNYERICGLPWDQHVAGPQRVWFAVYDNEDERRLRLRLGLFKEATEHTSHAWLHRDLTDAFAVWLTSPPYAAYAERYFASPKLLGTDPLNDFKRVVADVMIEALHAADPAEDTVVAFSGVASLFGFVRVSELLPLVEPFIRGRLLVLFPGVYEENNYRLLDARDGWNYRAVPILALEGEGRP